MKEVKTEYEEKRVISFLLIYRRPSHMPGTIRTIIEGASPTRRTSVSKGGREGGRGGGRERRRNGRNDLYLA